MGAGAAGKTSIVVRFSRNQFGGDQESTIGAAFISREITTDKGTITLHIWDTAGQERYKSLIPKYSQGSKAVIIVFDINDIESYEAAKEWVDQAKDQHKNNVNYYLVASKTDLPFNIELEKIQEYANEKDLIFMQTSAKTGFGINELFEAIAVDLIKKFPIGEVDAESVIIDDNTKKLTSNKCCN